MSKDTHQISTITQEGFYENWDSKRMAVSIENNAVVQFFKPYLDVIPKTALGEFYWQIFDNAKPFSKILMVGGDVEKLTPNTAEELLNMRVEDFFTNFHPSDLSATLTFVIKAFEILFETPLEKRNNYNFSIFVRIKNHENKYCWNCLQYPALYFDNQGNLLYGLALYTNIDHLMKPDAQPMMTILNSTNKNTQIFTCMNALNTIESQKIYPNLTKREREIIALLAQGKASKQIAPILGIKKNTVDNHRQRLLKKFGVSSSSELIFKTVLL